MNANLERLGFWVTVIATVSLSMILVTMTVSVCIGLFDTKVDNNKIFEMLVPAFQTIVGGFIGLITVIKIGSNQAK